MTTARELMSMSVCAAKIGERDRHKAEGYLVAPDGKRIPGVYCRAHAEACIAEYSEKLSEQWTFEAVR